MSNFKERVTSLLLTLLLTSAVIWMIVSVDQQQMTIIATVNTSRRSRRYSNSHGKYSKRVTSKPGSLFNRALSSAWPSSSEQTNTRPKVNNYPEKRHGLDYYYSKGIYGDYNQPSKSDRNKHQQHYSYYGSSNEFKKLTLIVLVPLTLCLVLFILLSFAAAIKSLGYYLSNFNYTAINGTYYYGKINGLFGRGLFGFGGNRGVAVLPQQQQQQSSNNNNANNINDVIIIYH